jgi:hypothetical protein
MKKYLFFFTFITITAMALPTVSKAQLGIMIGPRIGYGYPSRRYQRERNNNQPPYKPTLNISIGYGFPNLDKYQLPGNSYNYYQGSVSQTGPITAAIDYQFSRMASIGLLVTHGKVNIPYYNYGASSSTPAYTGSLNNWSFLLNYITYMPVAGDKVSPYFRTAIGINTWNQNFTDGTGNKINVPNGLPDLAYQLGLGIKFKIAENTGLFIEGGYGKYILHGGLSFKL